MIHLSISDGVSLGAGRCALLLQPHDEENEDAEFYSLILKWAVDQSPEVEHLAFIAFRLIEFQGRLIALGRLGQLSEMDGQKEGTKIIGPKKKGFLSDMRVIGGRLYTVGMRRQAYVSNNAREWEEFDRGVRDESRGKVTEFRAIDGLNEFDIYAVGRCGEIWHRDESGWSPIDTPTNVILEQVCVVDQATTYAAGQAGIVLRGGKQAWSIIPQAYTEEDFWGLEYFRSNVYMLTRNQIFKICNEKELVPVRMTGGDMDQLSRLRTGHGAMWSFGLERAYWTEDGDMWHEASFSSRATS